MGFCTQCGSQLSGTQKFCTVCGKPCGAPPPQTYQPPVTPAHQHNNVPAYQPPFQQQIIITTPQQRTAPETKWETPRLVIGIITIVLFFLLQLQSCVVGVGESIQSIFSETAGTSGMTGYITSFFFLIAGIVSIVCRKSKGGAIAAGVVYAICTLGTIDKDFSYFADLAFYCLLSFVFAGIMIIGGVIQKKH